MNCLTDCDEWVTKEEAKAEVEEVEAEVEEEVGEYQVEVLMDLVPFH